MTSSEFQNLTRPEQITCFNKGLFIGESKDQYGYITICRKIGLFYVEYLHKNNKLINLRVFGK